MNVIQYKESYSSNQITLSERRINKIKISAIIAIVVYLFFVLLIPVTRQIWWFVLIIVFLLIVMMQRDKTLKNHRIVLAINEKGLNGEDIVCADLKSLDNSWTYIRNYSNRYACSGDIDGILVGPKGMFLLEVKNWHGSFRVSGTDMYRHLANDVYKLYKSPIDQLSNNTQKLTDFLAKNGIQIKSRPFVVLIDGQVESYHGPTGIFIAGQKNIVEQILKSPDQSFSAEKIQQIINILK